MVVDEKFPVQWHKSTIFATFCVAATAFTCPGIFGALNGMGAGGGASPDISNAANAIVFGVLAVFSPIVGAVANRITPKYALLIGTLGYTPYTAGLYCNDRFGTNWLLLFGAALLVSVKFGLQALGASIGGIISLALNLEKSWRGSVSNATYIVLMTIMTLGFPFALLLPSASRVQRTDGRKVVLTKQPSILKEFSVLKKILKRPALLSLFPLYLYSQWFLSYQWQFNFAYFTVLDWTRFSRKTRAKIGFGIVLVTSGTSWILGQALQAHYTKTKPTLDWANDGYGLGAFLFTLWGASDPLITTYQYWLSGTLTNDLNETSFLAAVINTVGCVGSTFGFVVSALDVDYDAACAINTGLFFASIPSLAWVAFTQAACASDGFILCRRMSDCVGIDRTLLVGHTEPLSHKLRFA
ncbi:uncharacterized protein BDZ99DRAFT_510856 [Mytilinidion resinicola]|uniref:MFS general substrate transporter n=1 Tax=Mytilinidion resinicola TaxID=574789 RepID=A0A6A6YBG0_9PEZI|nr:uncharacterized protein BDZ99DRAFT_510856 [Mytilinidion resinicola]KAF2805843.1 hypothetical protein BDZ99DRAFT_510856 [Mytilinidion resinicola]